MYFVSFFFGVIPFAGEETEVGRAETRDKCYLAAEAEGSVWDSGG